MDAPLPPPRARVVHSLPQRRSLTSVVWLGLVSMGAASVQAQGAADGLQVSPAPQTVPVPETRPPSPAPSPASTAAPAPTTPPVQRAGFTFTPSAQVRIRSEVRIGNYLPAVREDEYFITSRVRAGLDVRRARIRLLLQAQDVRNFGDTLPGNDGGAGFGIHQGIAEIGFDAGYVRAGRQEINLGSERMLGALDWTSAARSFDAVRLHLEPTSALGFDAFVAVVRGESAFLVSGAPETSAGDYFGAAQASYAAAPAFEAELTYFVRHDGATATAPTRDRTIHSPTIRLSGSVAEGAFRYDAELAVQSGTTQAGDHHAYAAAFDGFARVGAAGRPTVDFGASYATGSRGDVDEFDNMFPTNHKFYGFMDLLGLRNLVEGHVGIAHRFSPHDLTLAARAFSFALDTTASGSRWSNAVGATLGAPNGGSRHLGGELDVWLTYAIRPGLGLVGGYSLFAPGAAAEAMGRAEFQHWTWLQLNVFTP